MRNLKMELLLGLLLLLCAVGAKAQRPSSQTVEGTFRIVHGEMEDGQAFVDYQLKTPAGRIIHLHSANRKDVLHRGRFRRLRVRGVLDGSNLIFDGNDPAAVTVLETSPAAISSRRVAEIYLAFPDQPPPPFSTAQMLGMLDGVRQYFTEVSYNKRDVSYQLAPASGYYTASKPQGGASGLGCNFDAIVQEAIRLADNEIDFRTITNVQVQMPTAACGFLGIATVGENQIYDSNDGPITVGPTMVRGSNLTRTKQVSEHELGHNFGAWHANYLACYPDSYRNDPVGSGGCVDKQYADPYDVMGSSAFDGGFTASHREVMTFLEPSNVVTLTDVGEYSVSLGAIETAGDGPTAIKVPIGDGRNIWVEFRQPIGLDAAFGGANFDGAWIRIDGYISGFGGGGDSHIIDATPAEFVNGSADVYDSAYRIGEIFTEPVTGIQIAPTAVSVLPATPSLTVSIRIPVRPKIALTGISPVSTLPGFLVYLTGYGLNISGASVRVGATLITGGLRGNVAGTEIRFTVPDMTAGTYPVTVINATGTSNALNLEVMAAVPCVVQQLTFGQSVFGQIDPGDCVLNHINPNGGRADVFSFNGTAGQGIAARGRHWPQNYLLLYGPMGAFLGWNFSCPNELTTRHSCIPFDGGTSYTLPMTGIYRLEIISPIGLEYFTEPSPYLLILDNKPIQGCVAIPMSYGQSVNGTLMPGDCGYMTLLEGYEDFRSFAGTAGEQIRVELKAEFDSTVRLSLGGTSIARGFDCGSQDNNSCIPHGSPGGTYFTLPFTGLYTIEVTSTGTGWPMGAYTLSLSTSNDPAPPPPPPAPTATFSVFPTTINQGQSATLSWSTANATAVSIVPGVGSVGLSGTQAVFPAASTNYTLTATGSGGTITVSTTLTVLIPPPPPPASPLPPTNFSISRQGRKVRAGNYTLSVTAGIERYRVYRNSNNSGFIEILVLPGTTSGFVDGGAHPVKTNIYQVQAEKNGMLSAPAEASD